MEETETLVGQRFQAERKRLRLGVQEAADACGITRNAVNKIERAGSMPSGAVLQAFAEGGADVAYVLTGKRAAQIDVTLFGVIERALAEAYQGVAGPHAPVERLRARIIALAYNAAMERISPDDQLDHIAKMVAAQMIVSLDDPEDPGLLTRNMLRPVSQPETTPGSTSITVAGDGNRVAGRDIQGKE